MTSLKIVWSVVFRSLLPVLPYSMAAVQGHPSAHQNITGPVIRMQKLSRGAPYPYHDKF